MAILEYRIWIVMLVIGPVVLLIGGLGLSHFMPSKRRVIGIRTGSIGGLGAAILALGLLCLWLGNGRLEWLVWACCLLSNLSLWSSELPWCAKKSSLAPAITAKKSAINSQQKPNQIKEHGECIILPNWGNCPYKRKQPRNPSKKLLISAFI